MSKLTKEQWKQIEAELSRQIGVAKLLVDGYNITAMLQRIGKMRLAIVVYVNGGIDGGKMTEATEIKLRFFCPKKQYVFSAKYRRSVKRMSKRRRELMHPGWNDTTIYYWPWWSSFKALRRHLEKNNESIELIEPKPLDPGSSPG